MKSVVLCLRVPGVEPGSTAWKAAMLTATPHTLLSSARTFNTLLILSHRPHECALGVALQLPTPCASTTYSGDMCRGGCRGRVGITSWSRSRERMNGGLQWRGWQARRGTSTYCHISPHPRAQHGFESRVRRCGRNCSLPRFADPSLLGSCRWRARWRRASYGRLLIPLAPGEFALRKCVWLAPSCISNPSFPIATASSPSI